jgi:hypothetical protein
MSEKDNAECCPRFNPDPWDKKIITWEKKLFLQDRVISLFHIPLNYGAVRVRTDKAIRAARQIHSARQDPCLPFTSIALVVSSLGRNVHGLRPPRMNPERSSASRKQMVKYWAIHSSLCRSRSPIQSLSPA